MYTLTIETQRANELHDRLLGTPYATDFEAIAQAIEWATDTAYQDGHRVNLHSERDWSNVEADALGYLGIDASDVHA